MLRYTPSFPANSPFTLHTRNNSALVWTGLLASLDRFACPYPTMELWWPPLSRVVPRGMVPHLRGGPDWYRTVSLASVNRSVPLVSRSTVIFS